MGPHLSYISVGVIPLEATLKEWLTETSISITVASSDHITSNTDKNEGLYVAKTPSAYGLNCVLEFHLLAFQPFVINDLPHRI